MLVLCGQSPVPSSYAMPYQGPTNTTPCSLMGSPVNGAAGQTHNIKKIMLCCKYLTLPSHNPGTLEWGRIEYHFLFNPSQAVPQARHPGGFRSEPRRLNLLTDVAIQPSQEWQIMHPERKL